MTNPPRPVGSPAARRYENRSELSKVQPEISWIFVTWVASTDLTPAIRSRFLADAIALA